MNPILRIAALSLAWLSFVLGVIGVFVPVIPTTPLVLLATFLFGKCSPRCHRWIVSTPVYRRYVGPFKQAGGMPVKAKMRMLMTSFAVLALSAALVQKPFVWAILGAVAVFLIYLVCARIPTVGESAVAHRAESGNEA